MCWMSGRDRRSEDRELEGDERFGIGGHHTLFASGFMSSVFCPSQAPCVTSWRHHLEPKKKSLTMCVYFLSLLSLLRYESAVDGLKNTQQGWRKMERKWTFFNFKIHNVAKHNSTVLISDYISIFWLFSGLHLHHLHCVKTRLCFWTSPISTKRGEDGFSHCAHLARVYISK